MATTLNPGLYLDPKKENSFLNNYGAAAGGQVPAQVPVGSYGTQSSFMPNGFQYGTPQGTGSMFGNNNSLGGSGPSGFGMNLDTFNMAGNALGGLGKLAQGWAAIKGLGIAEDQMMQNQTQFDQNFGMQEKAYDANVLQTNNRINDQNAWKTAQGRTDLAQLVV